MRAKYKFQVWQDTALTLMLFSLMGFHLWGETIHEWLGVALLVTLLLHNGLNTHWFARLGREPITPFRASQIIINLLLGGLMLAALISGLMLSRHVVPDLWIHSTADWVRKVHMTAVHWGFIVVAVHLGMHWKMLGHFFCQVWRIAPGGWLAKYLMPLTFSLITLWGIYAFFAREMLPYLLIAVDFAFFDYGEPWWHFYGDHLAVLAGIAFMVNGILRCLVWVNGRRPR